MATTPKKSSFPKDRPPPSIGALRRWIRDYAQEKQLPERRIFRAVSFMLVAMVLERVTTSQGHPRFLVKGGVSLELRLKLTEARTTQDFDAVFRGQFSEWLDALDDALADDLDEFSFSRREPEEIRQTKTFRVRLAIDYKGSRWGQVQLEVAPEEEPQILDVDRVEPFDLGQFGLDSPGEVAVVGLPYLVAQKLHACSQPAARGKENERVHDLMDLLLVRSLLPKKELKRVREACIAIFANRDTHPWPPEIIVYESWPAAWTKLAEEEDFPITDVEAAAEAVREFIAEIDQA